ncbi:hypothetical protein [Flavobacterium sp. C4GT6]|uniref:hypothetical protein n=1 Tax=Flavobacterium sp. C4GT6 TaxID=3103818 RepID=UPI002ED1815C
MNKIYLYFLFCFTATTNGQTTEIANIFLQSFSNVDSCYKNSKEELVLFSKYYSETKLNEGVLKLKDSLVFQKLNRDRGKMIYYLRHIYSKDTINGIYVCTEYMLTKNILDYKLKKLNFSPLPNQDNTYECNDIRYEHIIYAKLFYSTGVLILPSNTFSELYITLIKEDCSVSYKESIPNTGIEFIDDRNFLGIKNKNSLILIFNRYLNINN